MSIERIKLLKSCGAYDAYLISIGFSFQQIRDGLTDDQIKEKEN